MLSWRVLVSTIFLNVFCNFAHAFPDCTVKKGFDIEKLEGTWHFIGVISPRQLNVQCGYLYLERKSEEKFTGSRISWHNGHLRTSPVAAEVHDDKMILKFETWEKKPMSLNMTMKTCDGESEFALEAPGHNLYLIFGLTRNVSPAFLREYRAFGHQIGIRLRLMQTTNCY